MYNLNTAGTGGGPLPRLNGAASPTDYPYGQPKNDDPPGSGNGTALQYELASDPLQAMYACLVNGGVSPSETAENVNTSDFLTALKNMFFSVGDLKYHYGSVSPSTNWLVCDGSTFSAGTYPALNAFLGGTTLPDFRGRAIVDLEPGQPIFDAIGDEGGEITHQLSEAELAVHNHGIEMGDDLTGSFARTASSQVSDDQTKTGGGDQPHNNLQPYKVAMLLIKAK